MLNCLILGGFLMGFRSFHLLGFPGAGAYISSLQLSAACPVRIANAIYFALKEYSLYPPMRKAGDAFLINLSPITLYHEITLTETFTYGSIGSLLHG